MKERLGRLIEGVRKAGIRVDGAPLAEALMTEEILKRLEIFLDPKGLPQLKKKGGRLEFITDGPLPPELMEESPAKRDPIFRQVIGYNLCKACRLCIEVCPKHVYSDDGFGRPDAQHRLFEECTGAFQCSQCISVCPESTIHLVLADPAFRSTVFFLLPNRFAGRKWIKETGTAGGDFFVANPLEIGREIQISGKLDSEDLGACHLLLNEAGFYPVIDIYGYSRQLVDSCTPEADLQQWAKENGRDAALVVKAVRLLYTHLTEILPLRQGKYRLGEIIHRLIDEFLHEGMTLGRKGARELLRRIVDEASIEEKFQGAKKRPIGGLLPMGTSIAWKTPYGEEVPNYVRLEKCLGPECGLCVTHCPEGGGGENTALKMVLKVPAGVVGTLVRGLKAYLIRLDGTHAKPEDIEDLSSRPPLEFEVNPDFCKSCGICITCCPHDVIEPIGRTFDLKQRVA